MCAQPGAGSNPAYLSTINNNLINEIMKLKIKTLVPDSRKPAWLLRLLIDVKAYVPSENIKDEDVSGIFRAIKSYMDDLQYVRRKARYKMSDCVNVEEVRNKMTIYTVFKNTPMVEFTIE